MFVEIIQIYYNIFKFISQSITIIFALAALVISSFNVWYTWHQNQRRIDIILRFNNSIFKYSNEFSDIDLDIIAVNSGYHSVALINYEFVVNNHIIEFNKVSSDEAIYDPNYGEVFEYIHPKGTKLPHVLKEGEICLKKINATELSKVLIHENFEGVVKISVDYLTAQNQTYVSDPFIFDIDKFKD